MSISVKVSEVRVAQQLGMLASFPPVGLIVLLAIGVIHPTFVVAALFAAVLLVIDMRALRTVSRMFDRERLVTGAKGHQGDSILSAWSIAAASGRLISRRHASIRR
jgi:ABC-2 type transport system permease protein